MKNDPAILAKAFDLLHEFDGGTFHLEKTGDLTHGESWIATFYVGYGRHKYQAEAMSPAAAIAKAALAIPNAPKADIGDILLAVPSIAKC